MKRVLFDHISTPTCSELAVAKYSAVGEKEMALQVEGNLKASIKCPVGRSHAHTIEEVAASIHLPSLENVKSANGDTSSVARLDILSSRMSLWVVMSMTRIHPS